MRINLAMIQTRPDEIAVTITGDRQALEAVTEIIVQATSKGLSRGIIRNDMANMTMRVLVDCTDSMPGN